MIPGHAHACRLRRQGGLCRQRVPAGAFRQDRDGAVIALRIARRGAGLDRATSLGYVFNSRRACARPRSRHRSVGKRAQRTAGVPGRCGPQCGDGPACCSMRILKPTKGVLEPPARKPRERCDARGARRRSSAVGDHLRLGAGEAQGGRLSQRLDPWAMRSRRCLAPCASTAGLDAVGRARHRPHLRRARPGDARPGAMELKDPKSRLQEQSCRATASRCRDYLLKNASAASRRIRSSTVVCTLDRACSCRCRRKAAGRRAAEQAAAVQDDRSAARRACAGT